LGLLTKGPVALLLVMVPLVAYHALDRRSAGVSFGGWLQFAALAVGVAAPWYLAIAIQNPASAADFFWLHNVLRFIDPIDHAGPIWFYLPLFLMGAFPWIVLVIPALRRPIQEGRPSAAGFFAIAMLWPLLFFSLSECKRPAYILPVFPPLAMFAGTFFARRFSFAEWLREGPRAWRLAGATSVVVVFVLAIHIWLPAYHRKFGFFREVTPYAELAADPRLPVVCYPRGSESVNFYLKRSDVRTFSAREQKELLEELRSRPRTLVFVRGGTALENLLKALPKEMKFQPRGAHEKMSAALIERESANPD
jgi:4-amino-4-deoxy-L-arabinose transferase-like glycosyltransferase